MKIRTALALFFPLSILISVLGCSSSDSKQDSKSPSATSRKMTYSIDAQTKGTMKPGATVFVETSKDDLKKAQQIDLVEKAFLLEGYKKAADAEHADFKVSAEFRFEKPFTGISIGIISDFKHIMTLKARKGDSLVWQMEVKGESEYEELDHVLPQLLGASQAYIGKKTAGVIELRMHDRDPRVLPYLEN